MGFKALNRILCKTGNILSSGIAEGKNNLKEKFVLHIRNIKNHQHHNPRKPIHVYPTITFICLTLFQCKAESTLSQNNPNLRIKNRAFHGWRRCIGLYAIVLYYVDILITFGIVRWSKKSRIRQSLNVYNFRQLNGSVADPDRNYFAKSGSELRTGIPFQIRPLRLYRTLYSKFQENLLTFHFFKVTLLCRYSHLYRNFCKLYRVLCALYSRYRMRIADMSKRIRIQ